MRAVPLVSCQGTQGRTAAAGELCPGSTWHTACQPLLLGHQTPQTQPPNCQDRKGPSRDQLHLLWQGHLHTQVALECPQTGRFLTLPGQPVPALCHSPQTLLSRSFPKKSHHRHFPGASSPNVALPGQPPPSQEGTAGADVTETATTAGAPGSGGEVTPLSPAPVPPGAPSPHVLDGAAAVDQQAGDSRQRRGHQAQHAVEADAQREVDGGAELHEDVEQQQHGRAPEQPPQLHDGSTRTRRRRCRRLPGSPR